MRARRRVRAKMVCTWCTMHMVCIWCTYGAHSYRQRDTGGPAEVAFGERFCFSNVCTHTHAHKDTHKVTHKDTQLGYFNTHVYQSDTHIYGGGGQCTHTRQTCLTVSTGHQLHYKHHAFFFCFPPTNTAITPPCCSGFSVNQDLLRIPFPATRNPAATLSSNATLHLASTLWFLVVACVY